MRILVLGAGAVGGYLGGRLAASGAVEEVAFVVRPNRRAALDRDGLVIESPHAGDLRQPVTALLPGDVRPGWDVVLFACKAYDLADAIETIRPAVDGRSAVLPILNGLSHIDVLVQAFGEERVLGGLAGIQATLTAEGVVRHLAPLTFITFGELAGPVSPRVAALKAAFDRTHVTATASTDIRGAMWSKLVFLGTLAAATVLMRANLGEIAAAPGGAAWLERLLSRSAEIAAAHGHPVPPSQLEGYATFFRSSHAATASMLRDLEGGGRIEADHILGYLLEAARRAGVPDALHEAAFLNAKAYEARRAAGRLPMAGS
ncbi:ketopantoate reductase family protein [Elioraea sp.]|uniref:ketopantoate reductase family protein n=1 Tax=Elioraea sp. TaxID=2185103 RepID=UPI0025C06976|nr:ketopantoate reductase family protein [Elioraea sp.]